MVTHSTSWAKVCNTENAGRSVRRDYVNSVLTVVQYVIDFLMNLEIACQWSRGMHSMKQNQNEGYLYIGYFML